MITYGIYNSTSGIFDRLVTGDETSVQLMVNDDEDYMVVDEDFSPNLFYLLSSVITAKPKMSLTIGKTTLIARELTTVSGIPNGALVEVLGRSSDTCTDGEVIFDLDAGIHIVRITLDPYKPIEITYYVNES